MAKLSSTFFRWFPETCRTLGVFPRRPTDWGSVYLSTLLLCPTQPGGSALHFPPQVTRLCLLAPQRVPTETVLCFELTSGSFLMAIPLCNTALCYHGED